jgi:hypothetical protein
MKILDQTVLVRARMLKIWEYQATMSSKLVFFGSRTREGLRGGAWGRPEAAMFNFGFWMLDGGDFEQKLTNVTKASEEH